MICSSCGRTIPAHSPTCPSCGLSPATDIGAETGIGLPTGAHLLGRQETASFEPSSTSADAQTAFSAAGPFAGGAHSSLGTTPDTQGPLRPGEAFGARYHIIRLLGIGGMGAVYQAWDAELGVAVAIKVILPSVTSDPAAAIEVERRFKRELLLAREVTHKNVVRIHDLGEIDGVKYITMSYVDGEDLATMMQREGRLPVTKVLSVARPIVSGLMAAHVAGIVHRDLKPANIMVEKNGEALIMDFGIARSTSGPVVDGKAMSGTPFRPPLTQVARTMVGAVVGTVAYMAPEQAKGQQADQRADIYALGLIQYDMLVGGRRAEHAPSAIEELRGRMERAPQTVKSVIPEVPDALNALISKCLEPDPAKRYQTTQELAADLDRLDEHGELIPIKRVVGMKILAAVVAVGLMLLGGSWWYARTLIPAKPPEPVSVVIADFTNTTGDQTFDRTLESTLRRALEESGFISAYDRSRIRPTFDVQPPDNLDEAAARQLAVKESLGVVLSGAIGRRGNGYEISVKAGQAITGDIISDVRGRASSKEEVLAAAASLAGSVRKALGDRTSDSSQLFALTSVSSTSLEVVRHYATAIEAQSDGKYEEARQSYLKTVELDPKFGLGYQGAAVMSRNLRQQQDADRYIKEALNHLDGMTERERFVTRAFSFRMAGDYQRCVKEYGEMTARYAADATAHNNRVLCLSKLRNMREAVDEMRLAVQILPKRVLFRSNLAIYSDYAGDFQGAEREARAIEKPNDLAMLAVAFAQLGRGSVQDARETYQKLATFGTRGASWSSSGLGDLALYEGRFSEAVRIFEEGSAADLAAKSPDSAARKLTSLAYAQLLRGQTGFAVDAVDKALAISKVVPIRFLAGRIFAEANALTKAKTLAADLTSELAAEPRAYGKIIEGEIALRSKDTRQAVSLLNEANAILDTWIGHFDLGRAYLEAGAFLEADSEFDRCIRGRGEALSLLVDEEPTYGHFPHLYYYQGRTREGLKTSGFADSYRAYLAIRGKSAEDRLLPEIRKRAGVTSSSSGR